MFPWADGGSLRDYWEQYPNQRPSFDLIFEALAQLQGIADAVHALHNCYVSPEQNCADTHETEGGITKLSVVVTNEHEDDVHGIEEGNRKSLRHGDLKPENLLRFADPRTGLFDLRIADLGLAKQHIAKTRDRTHLTTTRYVISGSFYRGTRLRLDCCQRIPGASLSRGLASRATIKILY